MATLKAALQEACFMELEDIPSEEELSTDETLTFSPAFEKKMKKLIRRANHPIRYRVIRAAACVLLAALLSGCTVLASSPEARAAFVGWVREVYETWYIYKYEGADRQLPKDVVFQPTWIPDGFVEVSQSASEDQICIIYKDDNFNSIMFVYTRNMESANLYIQWDEVDAQTVRIGDLNADLYLDQNIGGANALVWRTADALFTLHGNCSGDELIKIAESVTVQEVPK